MSLENLDRKLRKIIFYPINICIYRNYGFKTLIYKPIRVTGKKYISLGNRVNIWKGARIECVDKWGGKKYYPHLIIGDNTNFEQYVHITCAGNIEIGHDCQFTGFTMITNIDHDYNQINKNVLQQGLTVNDVKIGNYCFVGMNAKIFPGVTIGDNVIIGANSIVTHDIPSYSVAVGQPAKIIKKYDFDKKEWRKCE